MNCRYGIKLKLISNYVYKNKNKIKKEKTLYHFKYLTHPIVYSPYLHALLGVYRLPY